EIGALAGAAAIATARRKLGAVEGGENLDRAVGAVLDLQLQPMAAPMRAGAAGIRTQLLAPEEQRRGGLDNLDRCPLDAAGIGRGGEPVLAGTGTGTAIGDDGDGEAALRLRIAGAEGHEVDAGGALRRNPVGDRLAEAAEDDVRQHLADEMARG